MAKWRRRGIPGRATPNPGMAPINGGAPARGDPEEGDGAPLHLPVAAWAVDDRPYLVCARTDGVAVFPYPADGVVAPEQADWNPCGFFAGGVVAAFRCPLVGAEEAVGPLRFQWLAYWQPWQAARNMPRGLRQPSKFLSFSFKNYLPFGLCHTRIQKIGNPDNWNYPHIHKRHPYPDLSPRLFLKGSLRSVFCQSVHNNR